VSHRASPLCDESELTLSDLSAPVVAQQSAHDGRAGPDVLQVAPLATGHALHCTALWTVGSAEQSATSISLVWWRPPDDRVTLLRRYCAVICGIRPIHMLSPMSFRLVSTQEDAALHCTVLEFKIVRQIVRIDHITNCSSVSLWTGSDDDIKGESAGHNEMVNTQHSTVRYCIQKCLSSNLTYHNLI
jgi:hypothetical protein